MEIFVVRDLDNGSVRNILICISIVHDNQSLLTNQKPVQRESFQGKFITMVFSRIEIPDIFVTLKY